MLDGMKVATEGMKAMSAKQDIITNNLANAGTAGFRKEGIVVSSFTEILDRETGGMSQASYEIGQTNGMQTRGTLRHESSTHMSQGALKETGNPFDLSLDDNGKGFFTIQTERGIEFTRNGAFRLSTSGFVVTSDGSLLMGHKGPIKVDGSDFKVDDQGRVMVGDEAVDKILVSTFEDTDDMKRAAGGTSFVAGNPRVRATTDFRMKQGFLEQSNVNALQEMVNLMQVMRNYEANQKALQAHDQKLQKVVSEMGRVR